MTGTVDIVVPVAGDAALTRRCLDAILAAPVRTAYELVVVDDATSDGELARYLRDLAGAGRITLLELPASRGVAAALNRAFALHRDRDKVLVHSDAVVAGDWLDRLARHADAPDVGVIATFTNAVGSATYPMPDAANALPDGYDVAALDQLFATTNRGASRGLPAVHGPCLYFRQECLAAVGAFDGTPLEGDYGVEIEYGLRAGISGFRHRVAGDVFVEHAGHASFGAARARDPAARSRQVLGELYPNWPRQDAELREQDPLRPLARRVDLARLAQGARSVVVFVSHPWGGGVRRYMDDLAALISDRAEVLYLEPAVDDTVKLHWPRAGESFAAYFRLPDELPLLGDVLRAIGVERMHFHHVHGLPRAVLDLPAAAGARYDCTLHDYFSICPQYHLVTEDGRYCGEPDAMGCAACLTRRPSQWGLDITAWRGTFARFLRAADRVIAPSNDVAQRIRRYFPDVEIAVWTHPEAAAPALPRVARVVVLGNLTPGKGLHVVAACAADARARALPLTFRVIGSTTESTPQFPDVPLSIVGQYDDADLARLLASERPDVILFAAQVPETYAYTLTVAMDSGLPIVASALGALPERLAGYPRAVTVPWDAPAQAWNAALLGAAGIGGQSPERAASADERLQAIPLHVAAH